MPDCDEATLWLVAGAYQADRVRRAANNLAGWAVAYLKNRENSAGKVAARMFSEGAITFAAVLLWNRLADSGEWAAWQVRGGWPAQAVAGTALAWEIVTSMPGACDAAVQLVEGRKWNMDQCRVFAQTHATVKLAKSCLEVCRLMPTLFDGPDGPAQRKAAQRVSRELHGVRDEPPHGTHEQLADALERLLPAPPSDGKRAIPIVLNGEDEQPTVWGIEKPRLTTGQYRVVKALLDAHPNRLSKETLKNRSGAEDPIGMIDRLREKDADWRDVLDKPGQAHGGYGIRVSRPRNAPSKPRKATGKPRKPTPRNG